MFEAADQTLSLKPEEAGIHKYFFAIFDNFGNSF